MPHAGREVISHFLCGAPPPSVVVVGGRRLTVATQAGRGRVTSAFWAPGLLQSGVGEP